MRIKSFKELIVWQRAVELVREIYHATECLPQKEQYGLTSQMRRAAVSIPSNIAEGQKKKTAKEFMQFLRVASGSAAEIETQLILVKDLYASADFTVPTRILHEVQKMLSSLITKLSITATSTSSMPSMSSMSSMSSMPSINDTAYPSPPDQ